MLGEANVVLGIAATLAVAAIAAMWKLLVFITAFERSQSDARHRLRTELQTIISSSEDRLVRRMEILEKTSFGYRQSRQPKE